MEQDITKFLTQRPLAFRKIRTLERASHFANLYYSMKSVPRTPRYFDLTEITFLEYDFPSFNIGNLEKRYI